MQEIITSAKYVIDGNLFWQSMGMTTATAMFIGASLFHASSKTSFQKAVWSILAYAGFLIFTSFARVQPNISQGVITVKTYASSLTTLFITASYVLGMIIGYWILRGKEKSDTR